MPPATTFDSGIRSYLLHRVPFNRRDVNLGNTDGLRVPSTPLGGLLQSDILPTEPPHFIVQSLDFTGIRAPSASSPGPSRRLRFIKRGTTVRDALRARRDAGRLQLIDFTYECLLEALQLIHRACIHPPPTTAATHLTRSDACRFQPLLQLTYLTGVVLTIQQ